MQVIGLVGLSLLGLPLLHLAWRLPLAPPAVPARLGPPSRRDHSEAALREAAQCRTRAKIAVNREREALEAWDPPALADMDPETWRLQHLAVDQDGDLRRARALARRAAAMARTPEEEYAAAELLVLIEHKLGHHQAELQSARALVALNPQQPRAWMVMRRAARCNGLEPLARQAGVVVAAFETAPVD